MRISPLFVVKWVVLRGVKLQVFTSIYGQVSLDAAPVCLSIPNFLVLERSSP